jgi:hypothetical protein
MEKHNLHDNFHDPMEALRKEMALTVEMKQAAKEYNIERAKSLLDPDRRAWIYGLAGKDGIIRHVGVSFYPDYQLSILAKRTDGIGRWVREHEPAIVRLEEVSLFDRSKKVRMWKRRFKGPLIRRGKKVKSKPVAEMSREELQVLIRQQALGLRGE